MTLKSKRAMVFLAVGLVAGCDFAPRYARPVIQTPAAFKESGLWRAANPRDDKVRGDWWELFHDSGLTKLEGQVDGANQNVAAALANFHAARALVSQARSQYFPTISTSPAAALSRQHYLPTAANPVAVPYTGAQYALPVDASWEVDLWGRVSNTVKAGSYEAEATLGDLGNVRLTMHAEVATDYFQIRGLDAQLGLTEAEVTASEQSLGLTEAQAKSGLASGQEVDQVAVLLSLVRAQATDLGIQRALLEHAIAVLLGQPASSFIVVAVPGDLAPVSVPAGLPSQLLERRPDVAAAERRVAVANAQIGVARAAYFPALGLDASAGFVSAAIGDLLSGPSLVWAVGASLSQTLFDGGKRAGVTAQAWALYQGTVANYRQTVLSAFQSVEDSLSTSRILDVEIGQQRMAVDASRDLLDLAQASYRSGFGAYGDVITAETTWLGNRKAVVSLQMEQMTSIVQLIKALGGGWDAQPNKAE